MSFLKPSIVFLFVVVVGSMGSCVDIPDDPGTNVNQDFRSLARFVHADPSGASGALTIDGASAGNLTFPGSIAYRDVASGSRSLSFAAAPAQNVNFESEHQSTVLLYSPSGGGVGYLYMDEGSITHPYGDTGAPLVRFIHVGNGSADDVDFYSGSIDPSNQVATAGFADAGSHVDTLGAGAQTVVATSQGNYTATLAGGSGSFTMVGGNEFSYTVGIITPIAERFFDSAYFRIGPTGSPVHAINVFTQEITFSDSTRALSSDQEVPPVVTPTSAAGTGTYILTRDTLGNIELQYTITVSTDTTDTSFFAAHFHNADTGAQGPVVRNILVGTPFGDTTISGVWSSADAVQPLTPTLIDELIAGRIYVNFHAPANPAGAIRTQLNVDEATGNDYEGSFTDTTIIQELNAGNMYVTFVNSSGENSAQLEVQSEYGVATLNTAAYANGSRYTIVATGSGSTFQLLELTDRTTGATKPVSGGENIKGEKEIQNQNSNTRSE